jgi:hypothetical protein
MKNVRKCKNFVYSANKKDDFEYNNDNFRGNYNSNEVLLKCIDALKSMFNVDRCQINQPIIKSDITTTLANIKGVQTVVGATLSNLYDITFGYSGNVYDINSATKNGVIYPSLDPSIFEVKFPNRDIKGRVVNQ